MGAGYYTASGRVLQATADDSNTQLSLLEVRPRSGMVHQSTWQDLDGNGSLSVSDAVMVDGRSEVIVDKRLNVRVTPAR